jgi:hypothetical protein
MTEPMSQQGDNAEIEDENTLFVKTVLPHQLTFKPPLGSWSVKKMVINDNTVPVHNPKVSQSVITGLHAEVEHENTDHNPTLRP